MNPEYGSSSESGAERAQLERLLRVLFRILMACNVDRQKLADLSLAILAGEDSWAPPGQTLDASAGQHLACTDLVLRWRRDPRFADSTGDPKKLQLNDDDDSFWALCESTAPGYERSQILRYLEVVGAVRVQADGVQLLTDSVLACNANVDRAISPLTVLSHMQGFLSSVEYNLFRTDKKGEGRFERACYAELPKDLVPIFERFAEVRGQNLVDAVDDWLLRHQDRVESSQEGGKSLVGIGAYILVHDSNIFKTNAVASSAER